MDVPFTIALQVEEKAVRPDVPTLGQSVLPIRVTLRHHVHDVLQSIWFNSPEFRLKPVFLRLTDARDVSLQDMQFCELLDTGIAPSAPVTDFRLVIDYTLFNSPAIPRRDPVEELFDIVIEWNDSHGRTNNIRIRESLVCTVGVLKDYVADERNKTVTDGQMVDGSYFDLRYWSHDDVLADNSMRLSDVLQLDVTPLGPVLFELSYNMSRIAETETAQQTARFFVKLNSTVPSLREERCLFEVNSTTTIRDFVNQIIERADAASVSRTFFDQVKLYHDSELLSSRELLDVPIYDQLHLSEESLLQSRNIVSMDLVVHEHLSGVEGGILSREFLNDLRSNNRFQFLPNIRDDLAQVARESSQPHQMSSFEPLRIVLENGVEWHLTGDTYEMVESSSLTRFDTGSRQLLVNQSDLSTTEYELTLQLADQPEPIVVTLNSSQCIVVDQGTHQPYILLNPAAQAKLNAKFRNSDGSSCLQQIQIHMYDAGAPRPAPTPTSTQPPAPADEEPNEPEDIENINLMNPPEQEPVPQPANNVNLGDWYERFVNWVVRMQTVIVRWSIMCYLFGLHNTILSHFSEMIKWAGFALLYYVFVRHDWDTSHFLQTIVSSFWDPANPLLQVVLAPLVVVSWILIYSGYVRRVIISMVVDNLLSYCISRRTTAEIAVLQSRNQYNYANKIMDSINDGCKVLVLFVVTLVPSLSDESSRLFQVWKVRERAELREAIDDCYSTIMERSDASLQAAGFNFDIEEVRNFAPINDDYDGCQHELQYLGRQYQYLLVKLYLLRDIPEQDISQSVENGGSASHEELFASNNVPEGVQIIEENQRTTASGSTRFEQAEAQQP